MEWMAAWINEWMNEWKKMYSASSGAHKGSETKTWHVSAAVTAICSAQMRMFSRAVVVARS